MLKIKEKLTKILLTIQFKFWFNLKSIFTTLVYKSAQSFLIFSQKKSCHFKKYKLK